MIEHEKPILRLAQKRNLGFFGLFAHQSFFSRLQASFGITCKDYVDLINMAALKNRWDLVDQILDVPDLVHPSQCAAVLGIATIVGNDVIVERLLQIQGFRDIAHPQHCQPLEEAIRNYKLNLSNKDKFARIIKLLLDCPEVLEKATRSKRFHDIIEKFKPGALAKQASPSPNSF